MQQTPVQIRTDWLIRMAAKVVSDEGRNGLFECGAQILDQGCFDYWTFALDQACSNSNRQLAQRRELCDQASGQLQSGLVAAFRSAQVCNPGVEQDYARIDSLRPAAFERQLRRHLMPAAPFCADES